MKNRYKGICFRCGEDVEAEAGILRYPTFEEHMKWKERGFHKGYPRTVSVLEHPSCADKWSGTTHHYRFDPS